MMFLAVFLFVIGVLALYIANEIKAAQRVAEQLKVARLRRHADMELELTQRGDMAGVYGEFPPPPAMRGVGIYSIGDADD